MRKSQEGYLILVAVFFILLMGAISLSTINILAGNTNSQVKTGLSAQAYYIAESGINKTIRYWHSKGLACSSITGFGDLTNSTIGTGQFTVTGASTQNTTTLSSNISASATTIPLSSVSGFPSSGAIAIGSEGIYYTGISGNSLTNVIRGAGSTTPDAHNSGDTVTQDQCVLTSTGTVPNFSNPLAQRVIQATVFSFPSASATLVGSVGAIGSVRIVNTSLENAHACLTCPYYEGSNIQTNSTSNTFSGFSTRVNQSVADGNNLVTSSYPGNIAPDILEGTSYTTSSLWDAYFNQTRAYVQANADYVGTNIKSKSGQVIYANGNVSVSNGILGNKNNPVIAYIDGSLYMSSVSVYGIVYATGPVTLRNMSFNGVLATESTYDQQGVGFIYNYDVLSDMTTDSRFSSFINASSFTGSGGGGGSGTPNADYANMQEVFN